MFSCRLYGSYGAIRGNLVNWALQDITGGITDNFVFKDNPKMLKQIIDLCMERCSLISASIQVILCNIMAYSTCKCLCGGFAF